MKFHLELLSSHKDNALLDDFTPPEGIEYYKTLQEIANIPKGFPLDEIHIHKECNISQSRIVDLHQLFDIYGERVNIDNLILSTEILNTPEYFKNKQTVQVYVRPGWLSQYVSEAVTYRYTDHSLQRYKESKRSLSRFFNYTLPILFRILKAPVLDEIRISYKFNEKEFVEFWIKEGCSLYLGITEEQYQQALKHYKNKN